MRGTSYLLLASGWWKSQGGQGSDSSGAFPNRSHTAGWLLAVALNQEALLPLMWTSLPHSPFPVPPGPGMVPPSVTPLPSVCAHGQTLGYNQ